MTQRTAGLLGGRATFDQPIMSGLDAHAAIVAGLPNHALTALSDNIPWIARADLLEKAVGISLRTLQRRRKGTAPERLSQEQGSRAWKFAEIFAKASEILGSAEEAERFLEAPALALDGRCPIDLIGSSAGTELVEDHLERMRHGVYE
jgi:putative toxin-antitoxin system antitoxin component (TIGR02293 family)